MLGSVCTGAAEPPHAYVRRSGAELSLGNGFLEIGFRIEGKKCAATRLVNRLAGRTIPLRSDGFSIGLEGRQPLRSADFALREARDEAMPAGRRLTLCLENASPKVQLDVVYELGHDDFFVRRRLEIVPSGRLDLRQLDVWLARLDGKCSGQGFGSPVLLDDTFWGVEFPAGHNQFADGLVRLSHFPGRTVADRFFSKNVVAGVAEPGQAARRFQRYVGTLSQRGQQPLFVNYNTWWTLMPPTEKNSLDLVDLFKRKLFEPYGESIDTFTLDDGWDINDSLWEIDGKAFPHGFDPLVDRLKGMNARLGIWLSPSSGYGHAPWLSTHGYTGNSNAWYICQSDPKYRRDIAKVVTDLARKYDVAFFKFDGFAAACEGKGHAHLPGPYAQEANVEAFIELMTAVRGVRPNVYLDPTCGIWLSPWWLQYADSLWGEVSGDYPDIIVPAPVIRDSATTTRDAVFRQRCREHPGFPPAAIEHLGIIVISPEKWEDNAMMVVGRGCRLLTLYIDPKMFRNGDRDWAFLAALLKWVRHNAATLQHTELILGDPMKREPYGYAHFARDRGIVVLRNPFIEPRAVQIKLDESAGWGHVEGSYLARIVYPYHEVIGPCVHGAAIGLTLGAYETLLVEIESMPADEPVLTGARWQEQSRSASAATYAVFRRAGETARLHSASKVPLARADRSGGVGLAAKMRGVVLLEPAPRETKLVVKPRQVTAESHEAGWELSADCTASGSPATRLTMYVLVDPRGGTLEGVEGSARVNDRPVEVRVVRSPQKPEQAHGPHPWRWYAWDVPLGKSQVRFTLGAQAGGPMPPSQIGSWLWVEEPLVKETVTLNYGQKLPARRPDPLPMPIAMEHQRHVFTLLAPKRFQLGPRWPSGDRPIVHLDEVTPDECTQDYGKLERNRSVWEKPMTIAGKAFARGLGSHANGHITYELAGGNFKSFRCQVGRDEHAGDGLVIFQVWVDGKKVFDSGPMSKATPAKPVEINLQGAALLELRALDGGDGISGDHANWADAQLVRSQKEKK
jgi:hypothetical protein